MLAANPLISVTPGLMIWTIICFLIALFVLAWFVIVWASMADDPILTFHDAAIIQLVNGMIPNGPGAGRLDDLEGRRRQHPFRRSQVRSHLRSSVHGPGRRREMK